MIYLVLLLLSVASAILYRAGGMGDEVNHWIPKWLRQSWVRDWLCPLLMTIGLITIHSFLLFQWQMLLAYLITAGSLSTYWDFFPPNKGNDNFWMAGFFVGLSLFPLAFCGISIWLILIRAVLLALIWGGVNRIVNNNHVEHSDFIEEYTRGFTLVVTIVLLI